MISERGLTGAVAIDSAGTGAWHVGKPPDPRTVAEAARRGVELDGRARQFESADFARFDYVIAMDASNAEDLASSAPDAASREKIRLLRSFDASSPTGASVPDPYYGGARGFEEVFHICEVACEGLLAHLETQHDLRSV